MFKSPGDVAFIIFNLPVYWYGIILSLSALCGILLADYLAKYRDIQKGFIIDISPILVILGVLGARLYYCLLNAGYYLSAPEQILNIRQGGLSIHGMIFIGIVSIVYLSKKDKIPALSSLDVFACVLPLCQAFGRLGNFFNSEAFGAPCNLPWKLFIPLAKRPFEYAKYEYFHPAFLYEMILDLIVFVILFFVLKKTKKSGVVFFLYLILYSVVRLITEYIRIDSVVNIHGFPVAQIVSVIIIFVSIPFILILCDKNN